MSPIVRVPLMAAVVCGVFGVLEKNLGRDALLVFGAFFVTLLPALALCRLAAAQWRPTAGELRSDALVTAAAYAFLLWLGWSAADGPHPSTLAYAFVGTCLWVITAIGEPRDGARGVRSEG